MNTTLTTAHGDTIRQAKNSLYRALKEVKANHNPNQPWLTPPAPRARPNTQAAKLGMRADQNGTVRNLKLSDLGTVYECDLKFVASFLGIQLVNKGEQVLYRGKGGTMLHEEVERILGRSREWLTSATDKNEMFVRLPSLGKYTDKEYTGKKTSAIWGLLDGYNPMFPAGLEIKVVPDGEAFPEELTLRAETQAAFYAQGKRKGSKGPKVWFWLYLPADLSTLDPADITTYRVFTRTEEELAVRATEAWGKAKRLHDLAVEVSANTDSNVITDILSTLTCHTPDTCLTCPHAMEQLKAYFIPAVEETVKKEVWYAPTAA